MTPRATVFDDLEKFGSAVALIDPSGKSLSYSDLTTSSTEFAQPNYEKKLVFFLGDSDIDSIIAFVGLVKSGATLMLLSPDISQEKLASLCEIYRPHFMWGKLNKGPTSEKYLLTDMGENADLKIFPELSLLLPTSGSTGSPKFVRLSYSNVIANTNSIIESLGISNSDCAITTLPLNYSYGLSIVTTHLASGAKVVLSKFSVVEREFWDLVRNQQVTTFGGVPYTYQMLSRISPEYFATTSIKYLTQAGGKLSGLLVDHFLNTLEKSSAKFIVMYGQTEATARMSVALPIHLHASLETIGKPIPGGTFQILDAQLKEIRRPNTIGEIEYTGENVCLGFAYSAEDLALGDSNQGKLRTGDMGYFDEQGMFFITGRNNRFVKLFGNRVNLDDIEGHLASLGTTGACIGEQDKLTIYLESSNEDASVAEQVCNFLNIHKSAVKTKVVDRLPRNESGKILYAELN